MTCISPLNLTKINHNPGEINNPALPPKKDKHSTISSKQAGPTLSGNYIPSKPSTPGGTSNSKTEEEMSAEGSTTLSLTNNFFLLSKIQKYWETFREAITVLFNSTSI